MNLHLCQKHYLQMLIDENPLICSCHQVFLDELLAELVSESEEVSVEVSVEVLQKSTGVSTGCGSCLNKVKGLVECYQLKPKVFP